MSLNSVAGEDSIITQLKTIPNVDVMSGVYVMTSYKPTHDAQGMFKPYLTVSFAGQYQSYDHGIVGPEKDSLQSVFSVYCVAPDDRTTRQVRDLVKTKMLTNFRPADGGFLRPTTAYHFADADLGFTRYVHVVGFRYLTNLS